MDVWGESISVCGIVVLTRRIFVEHFINFGTMENGWSVWPRRNFIFEDSRRSGVQIWKLKFI